MCSGVVHRDIKPENILLLKPDDPTSVLLSDFDMSIEDCVSAKEKFGLVGTKGYTAPELGSMDYSYKVYAILRQPTCTAHEDLRHN